MRTACYFLLGLASSPLAAQDFPNRPVTLVLPVAPGGTIDINARPLAQALTRILGQTVVVLNRAGAGGAIGTAFVANSKPDGYMPVLASASSPGFAFACAMSSLVVFADDVAGTTSTQSRRH